jgi:hypothetical protein
MMEAKRPETLDEISKLCAGKKRESVKALERIKTSVTRSTIDLIGTVL